MDSIVWRFIVFPGHEFCQLYSQDAERHLEGTAVFAHEGRSCILNYHVTADAGWHTQSASVNGWLGETEIHVHLMVDASQRWWLNEVEIPQVQGCTDVDLNFSPSTNTLPIRRLDLEIGAWAQVQTAWLRFPGFTLEPLSQRYTRLEKGLYRYESGEGRFSADLRVSAAGLVTNYPGVWTAEVDIQE